MVLLLFCEEKVTKNLISKGTLANNFLLNVDNKSTRERCEICLESTLNTPEPCLNKFK